MSDRPTMELVSALQSLYRSREYSDLTIVCNDGSRHPVHKAILCPRSDFFAAVVRERRWKEGVEGEICLADDDPEIVSLMIEYFYFLDYVPDDGPPGSHTEESLSDQDYMSVRTEAGQYGHVYGTSAVSAFGGPVNNQESPFSPVFRHRADSSLTIHAMPQDRFGGFSGPSSHSRRRKNVKGGLVNSAPEPSPLAKPVPHLTVHAKVYAIGAKYDIGGLRTLALDKFKIQITAHWDHPEFAEAIHTVYHSTPSSVKELREIVADALGWQARLLDKPEIEVAVLEINGLAYELLKRSWRTKPEYID